MSFFIGELLEGEIIDFSHEGNGVLKIDNFTIFVNGGIVGDRVRIKIDGIKKSYALASVVEVLKKSVDRVDLDFELRESRGGIPLIDYNYEKQLQWKREKVKKDFEKIAGLGSLNILDTIGMENPYRYRNHVQVPIGEKEGKILMGFYELNSNNIIDMDSSILLTEKANRVFQIFKTWAKKYDIKAYDRRSKKGVLRHLGIRANKDNQVMLIIVTGSDTLPKTKELVDMLKGEDIVSIYHNINKMSSSTTYGRKYKKLFGEDYLLDKILDLKFKISPNSFFQINRLQTEKMYSKVVEYLDLDKEDIVYDLYSGIGSISLFLAEKAKKVYGIEIVKEAIEDAKLNAKLNNIKNVEFILGSTEEVFPKMIDQGIKANKIVLDPPRKGCETETLEAIVGLSPSRIVYVSCNPSTMARDIKHLIDNGYKVIEVQPIDMFPNTANVEAVTLIVKEQSD